jgi:DNA-binding NtrC family response regulator
MNNSIIVIDDDRDFLDITRRGLFASGYQNVQIEDDPKQAARRFETGEDFDMALIDMTMVGLNGIELLEIIKTTSPKTECIMVTALNEARTAVDCLKKGAYDYLVKPVSRNDLILSIQRGLERKRLLDILEIKKKNTLPELVHAGPFKPILTQSARVLKILKEAELHAASDVPILITGESGTGKELLARAIHAASPRSMYPFWPVNMASATGSLFDDEFFGHVKGAFTGADKDRAGYLENADKGSLFLDEIGTLPLGLQGKLLRFLQDGEFTKLGTSTPRKVDVRLIAATNEDLDALMAKKLFRKDLYYRLRGSWLHLLPLRERKEDIALLINQFLEEFCEPGRNCGLEAETLAALLDYDYPGNIRELRSIIQSAVNLAQGRPLSTKFLSARLRLRKPAAKPEPQPAGQEIISLGEMEKSYVLKVYRLTGENKCRTARLLGIGLSTVRRKLESYGLK